MYTTKIEQQTQVLFFVALSLALLGTLYRQSFWPGHVSVAKYIALSGLFLVFFRFLAVLYSMPIKHALLIIALCPFILYTCSRVHDKTYLLYPFLFCISAWNVNFRTVIKFFFWINLVFFVITIVSSNLGIIKNYIQERDVLDIVEVVNTGENKVRNGFGYLGPTYVGAHLTYLNLMWWYIRRGILKPSDYIILFISIWFASHYSDARTDAGCMCVIGLFSIVYKFRLSKKQTIFCLEKFVLSYSIIILASLMFFLTYQFLNSSDELYQYINIIISGRLQLGANAILEKGIPFLGQFYIQQGVGTKLMYNFIDCSYLMILIIYGIFTFILTMFVFAIISRRSVVHKEYLLSLILLIVAIQSFIMPGLLRFSYNPFFMAFLANIDMKQLYEKISVVKV